MLEVDRDIGEAGGNGDAIGSEQLMFPLLCGRVIDLEDVQPRKWIAISEGVETGTQQDILSHSACHGLGEQVFCITAARHHKGSQRD